MALLDSKTKMIARRQDDNSIFDFFPPYLSIYKVGEEQDFPRGRFTKHLLSNVSEICLFEGTEELANI